MKSSHSQEETEQAAKAISLLGGKLEDVTDYSIPTTDVTHRLLVIRKLSPTPKNIPAASHRSRSSPWACPGCNGGKEVTLWVKPSPWYPAKAVPEKHPLPPT